MLVIFDYKEEDNDPQIKDLRPEIDPCPKVVKMEQEIPSHLLNLNV